MQSKLQQEEEQNPSSNKNKAHFRGHFSNEAKQKVWGNEVYPTFLWKV
jgi:hypothetical protein